MPEDNEDYVGNEGTGFQNLWQKNPKKEVQEAISSTKSLDEIVREEAFQKALATYPERGRRIIELRFGLGESARPHTQTEVGELLNTTTDRIRQIEAKVFRSIQYPLCRPYRPHITRDFRD